MSAPKRLLTPPAAAAAPAGELQLIVRLGSYAGDEASPLPSNAEAPTKAIGILELLRSAKQSPGALRGGDLAVAGAPPKAETGAALLVLCVARMRPSAVVEFDTSRRTAHRRPLARYLVENMPSVLTQLSVSAASVAVQHVAAASVRGAGAFHNQAAKLERIAYLRPIAGAPSRVGGSVTHAHGVIRALRSIGLEIAAFTTDELIASTAADEEDPPCTWQVVGVPPACRAIPASAAFGGDLVLASAARAAARASQVIYQRHNRFSLVGALLARLTRRPLFLEYNGPESFFDDAWHDNPLAAQLRACEDASLRSATRIIVNSEVDRRSLQSRGVPSERLVFSPNGVEIERFNRGGGADVRQRLGIAPHEVVVGFVGSFGPWHGAPVLARAMIRLLRRCSYVRLLLVGHGVEQPLVRDVLESAGVLQRCVLVGEVRPAEVPGHLDACDILASPHVPLPGGAEFFGSPTKLFEYMAAGKAIVASSLGQIADVIEHGRTGLLVAPADEAALTAALERLVAAPDLRFRLGSAARDVAVTCHSWRRNAEQVVEAYDVWRVGLRRRS